MQRFLGFVPQKVHACESRKNIQAINSHRVVVIPQHRRVLLVGIVIESRFPRDNPILGIAIAFRRHFRPMKMRHRANFRSVLLGSMETVIDWQKMFLGKFVRPFDQNFLSAA